MDLQQRKTDDEFKFVPPGLQPGGSWLPVIRREAINAVATEAYVQVLKPPPAFVRWLLRGWLRFPERSQAE